MLRLFIAIAAGIWFGLWVAETASALTAAVSGLCIAGFVLAVRERQR